MARSSKTGFAAFVRANTAVTRVFLLTNLLLGLSIIYFASFEWGDALLKGIGGVAMLKGAPLRPSNDRFVTFIVPSKGRSSIIETLGSLLNQTDDRWEAIIIFDGDEPPESGFSTSRYASDPRIRNYTMPKMGEENYAALPRNYGMSKANSEWLAFVDDDDVLSPEYVAHLWKESRLDPLAETCVFRMSYVCPGDICIRPPEDHAMFQLYSVGISFAMKRDLFENGFWFRPCNIEDFKLLETIFHAKKRIVMSPYVTYYVRNARPTDLEREYARHYINRK